MTKHIKICGDIVDDDTAMMYDFFGMQCTSPKKVDAILNDDDPDTDTDAEPDIGNGDEPEDVVVDIASGGGDVSAGSQIYTALRSYQGPVTVNVVGLAASAASVIAMAGDKVRMSPTSQLMIHKAWSVAQGNSDDMNHESGVLSKIDQSLASAYEAKTGMKSADVLKMMQDETWMTAKDAVRFGFADSIMFDDDDDTDVNDPDTETDDDDTDFDQLQLAAATHPIPRKDRVNQFMKMVKLMDFFDKTDTRSLTTDKPKAKAAKNPIDHHTSLTQSKINSLLND